MLWFWFDNQSGLINLNSRQGEKRIFLRRHMSGHIWLLRLPNFECVLFDLCCCCHLTYLLFILSKDFLHVQSFLQHWSIQIELHLIVLCVGHLFICFNIFPYSTCLTFLLCARNHADARDTRKKQDSWLFLGVCGPWQCLTNDKNKIPFLAFPLNTYYNIFKCFSVLSKNYLLQNPLWLLTMQNPPESECLGAGPWHLHFTNASYNLRATVLEKVPHDSHWSTLLLM